MASVDPREALTCSICLDLYTEPVSLQCGHNFCQDCIVTALDSQEESGEYSCPKCKEQYRERPPLEINRKLSNIMEHFRSAHQKKTEVLCTYCDGATPASKTCLHCEASFCEKHLSKHSKSAQHVLIEPTTSYEDRKCSTHGEVLTYYCTRDNACICTSCWVAGGHRDHQVELLAEASEKKFKDVIEKLKSERQETEKIIYYLAAHRRLEERQAEALKNNTLLMFKTLVEELDHLLKRMLTEITTEVKRISESVSDLIRQMENQKDELSKKIEEIEELHKSTDTLILLKKEPISDDTCTKNMLFSDMKDLPRLDGVLLAQILGKGLLKFMYQMKEQKFQKLFSAISKSDLSLDPKTANNCITISTDLKSASCSNTPEVQPDVPERFKTLQVLSAESFSSGTHFWQVDVSAAKEWIIGMATHSIERKTEGIESYIGHNDKSWGLSQRTGLQAWHNNSVTNIEENSSLKTVGIYLDYEGGRVSFYQLCDPVRHLHTFTTTFKEPLHAAFYVFPNSSIRIIK